MKKGIELSLNFLVTIIIAFTIFMLGVRFIYTLASEATELESMTTDELDTQIGQLLCDSTDRVCIGIDKETIQKGKFDVFGIKVININPGSNFEMQITPAGHIKNNGPIIPVEQGKLKLKYRQAFFINRNEEESLGVGVEVSKDAESGTYILDVEVKQIIDEGAVPYGGLHKLYVDVP